MISSYTRGRGARPRTSLGMASRFAAAASLSTAILLPATSPALAQELVIGEERVAPGIVFIFEGAVRDLVAPRAQNLPEHRTHVHIEARVNWGERGIPPGTPPGGFVPYLKIHAWIYNEATRQSKHVTLVPHINLIDNFHYARNMQLPGTESDRYTVTFYVNPPGEFDLARHRDWLNDYQSRIIKPLRFMYRNVDFYEIATAPPRASAYQTPNVPQ